MIAYTVRPISDRTWLQPTRRTRSRFTAGWSDTLELLTREVDTLRGRDVVLEVDVAEKHIRQDGRLRADARPTDPAVVIAFESKHGPLLYRCDSFNAPAWGVRDQPVWQANVRAIALTLEALRAVDRYGATETGQQYAGFKALPAGRAMPASHMTTDEAYAVLELAAVGSDGETRVRYLHTLRTNRDELLRCYREARRATHPDHRDGDRTAWDQVEQAATVLGVA